MKQVLLIAAILVSALFTQAQKQGNIWYFGSGAGLDFNSGTPIPITGGLIQPYPQVMGEATYSEGSAVICDSTGALLFYCNGEKIWNKNHQVIQDGSGLMGMYSSTHPAFIIPKPLSNSLFYVFTTDGLERSLAGGLRYSVVDMCLDEGRGGIVPGTKNTLLMAMSGEKLAAINHANGKDIWLIAHQHNTNAFTSYQISENGIINTVVTNIGSSHTGNGFWSAIGQMKASPDGNRIGLVFSNVTPAVAEIFNFDKSTGVLSNHISLNTEMNAYGFEFSPNSSMAYITNWYGLHRFNLLAGNGSAADINASKTNIIYASCVPSGLQLGPDNKIYISRCSNYISCLSNPDATDFNYGLVSNAIFFNSNASVSFPSFINGYQYRNGVPCHNPLQVQVGGSHAGCTCSGTATAAILQGTPPYKFTWSTGDTLSAIDGLCAGVYRVTVTDNNGEVKTDSVVVNAATPIAVSITQNKDTICAGDSVQLCTDNTFGNYYWSTGAIGSCTYTRLSGSHSVTVTDGNNCTATASATVFTLPVSPISVTISGDTLSVANGTSVQWYLNDEEIDGATTEQYIANEPGSYRVAIVDRNGCTVRSNPISVIKTGINNVNAAGDVVVYPNPTPEGRWTVISDAAWLNSDYTLYDITGSIVSAGKIAAATMLISADVSEGIYILSIYSRQQAITKKLTVVK